MNPPADTSSVHLVEQVKASYGKIAQRVLDGSESTCCGSGQGDPITRDLYSVAETDLLPRAAAVASLGCGNPTALIDLHDGEVVLDLGSGGGIDVLLSARRVAPSGFVYGLDMTDEMLELAHRNQAESGQTNVEFLKGHMEDIPLPDASIDVVISNCVINLSADKPQVIREAFRVLRPGGRFAVSDVVVRGTIDPRVRASIEAWVGCVAGALDEDVYRELLADAGFTEIEIVPTRVYEWSDAKEMLAGDGLDVDRLVDQMSSIDGQVMSAFVRATKPAAG